MKNSRHAILKKLDSPMRILSFSVGDLISYLSPFFIGSMMDSLFIVPVIGIFLVFFIKKILKKFPKHYVMRWIYWSLPSKQFNKMLKTSLPPSHKRLWVK